MNETHNKPCLICMAALVVFLVTACNKGEEPIPEPDALDDLLEEIQQLSASQACEDADQWKFTAFGAKPCGGP